MTADMRGGGARTNAAPHLHSRSDPTQQQDSGPIRFPCPRPHPAFWPSVEEYDPGANPLDIAFTRSQSARIAAWEDEPLDPDDDLSIIADYPGEVARLRLVQDAIRTHPLYLVADAAGPEVRRRFLAEATTAAGVDNGLAEAYFEAELCTCILGREFSDGSTVYRGHRDAARCDACTLRASFERIAHQAVTG